MSQATKQQQRFITVSVRDLELNQVEDKPPLNDISCCLTVFTEEKDSKNVNNLFFDLLLLNDPQNSAKFKLLKGENQFLKVQLKTLSSQRLIATVNISLTIFADSNNIQIDQWINLSVLDNSDSTSNQASQKQSAEGNARIKMRFAVNEQENNKKVEDAYKTPVDTERVELNTTLQPCVNFPIKDEKRKYDFTPILNREELEQTQQSIQNINIESRLVLTPERQRIMENSTVFQNKFQELIEKLMETKNQSLILGVTRQLNESHRKDLEKNNLTEILKRLNESQNYIEDDLIENNDQYLNNINLSLSGIHQLSKKQGSPEQTRRNKCDLEGEIAKLRLDLEKKQEIEQIAKDLKLKLFNQERNNENLLNQYNKAVDNYQKYFAEINQENLELKKKIVAFEKENQQKDKTIQDLKDSFEDKLKAEKQKLQTELMQQNIKKDLQVEIPKEDFKELTQDQMSQKIHDTLIKHKQEISHYSQLLLEAQNESVEYQAKMIEMQKEIEILQQKLKSNQLTDNSTGISFNNPSQLSNSEIQNQDKSNNQANSSKKYTEEEFAYFEKIIKDKSLKISQLETEKAQIEFSLQKSEMKIKQLNENINQLESQLQSSSETKSEDLQAIQENLKTIQEENTKLKTQIEESEQLRSTLEDHLLKTKQNFQKKVEELQQKQQQTNNETKINKTKDESASMKKLVEELNQKSTIINELTYQNKDYKVKLQTQQEKIKILEFNQTEQEQLKKAVAELEAEKEKINMDLYAVTEDLLKKTTESISQQQVITQLSAEVKRLEKMIEDLLLRNPSQQLNYNAKKGDEIDEKLCEFLSNNVTPIKFVRIDEGLYNFGTKRIIVKLLKGKLVCRVGGGFMVIEEFLQLYTLQELIKMKQTGDYSLLNYPISEEKIDQLIQQDIQFNQQQYKQLNEQANQINPQNLNQGTPKQQLETLQTQQSQQNNYLQNPLRNSSNYNQIQQPQASNLIENFSQQYQKQQNSNLIATPQIQKTREFENLPQQENLKINVDDCQKENQQCRSSIELNQTPSKSENIYQKATTFTQCVQQQQYQQQNNIQQQINANHTPVYHNRQLRVQNNPHPSQLLQTQEERVQQISQHEENQEMLKYLIEQAHYDVHLRNELESLQSSIQMAANIKGSEIMRKYSQSSQNTNQQIHTFENIVNTLSNNQNSGSSQKQYPIDFSNSNYNYHVQQNAKTSYNGNNSRISSVVTNSSSRPPNTYSIRATPQKQNYQQEQYSANTSAINEFTPQNMNGSKAATPKRSSDLAQSAYQERIFRQYSNKRNPAENYSPYSHNRHSSITSTFSAQKKSYYIQK